MKSDLIDLELYELHRTDEAILVSIERDKKTWLPLSAVEIEETGKRGMVIVTLPERLAIDKGLV